MSDKGPSGPTPWREPKMHYDRQERERMRPARPAQPRGFFRRNRSLAILLLDLLFVVALFLIYLFFLRPLSLRAEVDGYRISAELLQTRPSPTLLVTIVAPPADEAPPQQPIVTVRFGGSEVSDLAPMAGQRREIVLIVSDPEGVAVSSSGFDETAAVQVTLGESEVTVPALIRGASGAD